MPFKVDRIEYLSGDRHVYGTATRIGEETRVIARLPATVPTPIAAGETHEFAVHPDRLRFFDAESGHRADPVPVGAEAMDAATTERPGVRAGRPARHFADNERQMAIWFLVPSILYVVALVAVPFFLAIGFAFSDVTAGDPSFQWAGLRTFERALDDPVFWRSLRNTFVFTVVSMALIVVLGKVLANILVADFRGKWLVRFLVLLPWTTPVALSAVAWLWMLDSVFSPIDWVLRNLGLIDSNVYWLGRPHLAMASVIAVHVWRLVPLSAVIILAGLVAIPKDIEEAARVDGAGFWRRMLEVTIP